jgi:hypothetical protein
VATTTGVTATPSGGVGPFSYQWLYVDGDNFNATFPSSQTTSFTRSAPVSTDPTVRQGHYRCAVTDHGNGGAIVYSGNVRVTTLHILAV